LALPTNAGQSARTLYRTVDAMWRAAGQQDTDFSFYTKRATLAAVYSATLLAWMADTSSDMEATEAFLDRRLRDVARIPQMTGPARSIFAAGQKLAEGIVGGMGPRTGR
jgi:ubiquinone biosynthesis protein COQ9